MLLLQDTAEPEGTDRDSPLPTQNRRFHKHTNKAELHSEARLFLVYYWKKTNMKRLPLRKLKLQAPDRQDQHTYFELNKNLTLLSSITAML